MTFQARINGRVNVMAKSTGKKQFGFNLSQNWSTSTFPYIGDELAERERKGWTVRSMVTRSDGYLFQLCTKPDFAKGEPVVFAGCRKAETLAWYRAHTKFYHGRSRGGKAKETRAILDLFAAQSKFKRWSN